MSLSLIKHFSDDEEESEEEQDIVRIQLNSDTIQVKYTQLFKYSKLIRDEYLISEARNTLSHKLVQFQQENLIDTDNIKYFFKLFQEDEISFTNDKYRDFLKLSEFLKVKKLQIQLKRYFELHMTDIDFVIRLYINEIGQQNESHQVNHLFITQMENLFINKINECLQNKLFQMIPVSLIYEIIEKCDKNQISNNILFDFIKKSLNDFFVLLSFIDIEKLSNDKFNELYDILFISDENETKKYFQYLPCSLEYIKNLKSRIQKLQNDKDELEIQLIDKVEENNQLKLKIKKLENSYNQINANMKKENKQHQISINQLYDEKNQLQNQIKLQEQKSNLLQSKYDNLNSSNEMFSITLNLLLGNENEINIKKAILNLKILSEKGIGLASYILGNFYLRGNGVEKDFTKAVFYFEKSSEQGNSYGLSRIGLCYSKGKGIEQDYSKAIEYYQKSADLGNSVALNNIGFCYMNGHGVEQSFSKAIEYFQKSADLGNSLAFCSLGSCYMNGNGVGQNYSKAIDYFLKSEDLGNPVAMFNLGSCYQNGQGVEQDYSKAIEYYQKAADFGVSSASKIIPELKKLIKE